MDWHEIQDKQIDNALEQSEMVFNSESVITRLWGFSDQLIQQKHLLNILSLYKKMIILDCLIWDVGLELFLISWLDFFQKQSS